MTKGVKRFLIIFCTVWAFLHIPAVFYGTEELPLHMSYIGDEQAPVNGALHVLQDKNLLAFRNLKTVYYGPLFSVVALPGVLGDFVEKNLTGEAKGAEAYKNYLLWDWGGIVWKLRFLAVLCGVFGIVMMAKLLSTNSINPQRLNVPVYLSVVLLGFNYFYFEYTGFFRHWAFIIPLLIAQLYCLVRLHESAYAKKYWIANGALFGIGFGISYMSALYQIMWLPLIIYWIKNKNRTQLVQFAWYVVGTVVVASFIVAWHPHAFKRIIGLTGGSIVNKDASELIQYSSEIPDEGMSFGYYSSILINNHLPLLLLFVTAITFMQKRKDVWKKWWVYSIGLPMVIVFVVFGLMGHHESRYVLPVVVLFILLTSILLVRFYGEIKNKTAWGVVVFCIFLTLLFHGLHIGKRIAVLAEGPKEREIIAETLDFQRSNPSSKILFIEYYILGYPHTKEAYADYAARFNKKDFNLYKTIAATPLPEGIVPLNVYYRRPDESVTKEEMAKYDRVVKKYDPALEDKSREPDFFEYNLLRLWKYEALQEQYTILR
jgi:hypothetical protein